MTLNCAFALNQNYLQGAKEVLDKLAIKLCVPFAKAE